MHYVVHHSEFGFMTPRRATGVMYENRTSWSDDINDARVFNNLAAAKNAAKHALGAEQEFACVSVFLQSTTEIWAHLFENKT